MKKLIKKCNSANNKEKCLFFIIHENLGYNKISKIDK